MQTIDRIATSLITVPLTRPWGTEVTEMSIVTVDLFTSDGQVGHGFSWTPSIGAHAIQAVLEHDIAGFVSGRPAEPADLWKTTWSHLHEAGSGGITTFALAGLDLALWDLAARRETVAISQLLGENREQVHTYGSGVNFHYTLDQLVQQVDRWIAAGHDAVKIKVGKPDLSEDLARVDAVRSTLGPERALMIDANQRWTLDEAIHAAQELERFDIEWLEEPLLSDDLPAHQRLKQETSIPLAVGENLHTSFRFREFLDAGAVDIVQPNVVRVGGITPFLEINALRRQYSVRLAPHLLPDLSGQLALSLEDECLVEDVEDAGFGQLGVLNGPEPVKITGNRLTSTHQPGLGLIFQRPSHDKEQHSDHLYR
jgi:L-alanine-DL-glutamate epimerase-like enolase superfamily enzyme